MLPEGVKLFITISFETSERKKGKWDDSKIDEVIDQVLWALANMADGKMDSKIIKHARDCAFNIVKADSELNEEKHKGIRKQFLKNYKTMLEFISII